MFNLGIPELLVLVMLLLILGVLLNIIALVDILKSTFPGHNKIIWVLVVLLFPLFGAILYYVIGRKQKRPA